MKKGRWGMKIPKLKCNSCDGGRYRSFDIHTTSLCPHKCPYCIDEHNRHCKENVPDFARIAQTIINHAADLDDVLFLGGEPCLYLEPLLKCIQTVKAQTSLKIYVTTSVPNTCFRHPETFFELIESVDGLNISAQHYNELIADKIRGTTSSFNRQEFYAQLPQKKKIRINLNLIKGFLDEKQDILNTLHHYDDMGFGSILIRELQHTPTYYASFEKAMDMHFPSAYSYGCQTTIKIPGEHFSCPIILKRSCPLVEPSIHVHPEDCIKAFLKLFTSSHGNTFGVVWEDGSLKEGW